MVILYRPDASCAFPAWNRKLTIRVFSVLRMFAYQDTGQRSRDFHRIRSVFPGYHIRMRKSSGIKGILQVQGDPALVFQLS